MSFFSPTQTHNYTVCVLLLCAAEVKQRQLKLRHDGWHGNTVKCSPSKGRQSCQLTHTHTHTHTHNTHCPSLLFFLIDKHVWICARLHALGPILRSLRARRGPQDLESSWFHFLICVWRCSSWTQTCDTYLNTLHAHAFSTAWPDFSLIQFADKNSVDACWLETLSANVIDANTLMLTIFNILV